MIKIKTKNKFGFTLIELLVVIAIIGILSSVVLASLNGARKKARDSRRVSDIGQLKLALELYFDNNKEYPTDLDDLSSNGFLSPVPKDPLYSSPNDEYKYAYCPSADPTRYHLGATLEDTNNTALSNDSNFNSSTGTCSGGQSYGGNPFDGSASGVYDVVQ